MDLQPAPASNGVAVLIPAYKPDNNFIELITKLRELGVSVWAVNDGSGAEFDDIFRQARQLGAVVLTHPENRGKGCALKTGLRALIEADERLDGVVTADADGQHTVDDILSVAAAMRDRPGALVLGVRDFAGNVPLKSRFGNGVTRFVYMLVTGVRCRDTQTGLRGLPRAAWGELADIEGDRYEYEMNMLLRLRDINCPLVQIPIRTIYLNQNKGSHFNAVRDAMRIYSVILRFAASSLASFAADYLIYLILLGAGWAVWGAYALARVLSGSMNFYLNRNWVFHKRGGWGAIARYAALWAAQLAVGAWLSHIFSDGNARIGRWIKLPIDSILFLLSYLAQRELVFNNRFMNDKK